jgi:hypothetical protein
MTAETFKRTKQRSLFTADVSAGARVGVDLAIEVSPQNLIAKQTSRTRAQSSATSMMSIRYLYSPRV